MEAPAGTWFCVGCPFVPDGVTAEVKSVSYTDMAEYRRLAITRDIPGFVENYVDTSMTVVSEAVESSNRDVEVGDEAVFRIERDGRTEAEAVEAIRACPHPKLGRIAKALGSRGVCQAVKAK